MRAKHTQLALRLALANSNSTFRLGAVIAAGPCVCSIGVNWKSSDESKSIHAEVAAVRALNGLISELKNIDLYVTRVLRNGTVALALPCPACTSVLAKIPGLSNIYYTDRLGIWRQIKIHNRME